MSSSDSQKISLLKQASFRYNFDRMVYFNRECRKVFSLEAIEDHDESWLRERLQEVEPSDGWRFYFNSQPTTAVQSELSAELDQ